MNHDKWCRWRGYSAARKRGKVGKEELKLIKLLIKAELAIAPPQSRLPKRVLRSFMVCKQDINHVLAIDGQAAETGWRVEISYEALRFASEDSEVRSTDS